MSLVIIFGPPAVGKMAVGHELQRLTGLRLFHNHATIELVLQFFQFGEGRFSNLVRELRHQVMEAVAASDLRGMIFTYVWALDDARDRRAVDEFRGIFERHGRQVFLVELEASKQERIRRNGTEFRLSQKASKRDTAASLELLMTLDEAHKLNSTDEFDGAARYIRIDNTDLSPVEAAALINNSFGLARPANG